MSLLQSTDLTCLPLARQQRLASILRLLEEARGDALRSGRDPWQFAVGIAELLEAGETRTDLRWLLGCGYIEQRLETTKRGTARRSFQKGDNLALRGRVSFVVAASTAADLASWRAEMALVVAMPSWNGETLQLFLGGQLARQYKRVAPNQMRLLNVFQELDWEQRIDDPLLRDRNVDPVERLRETVRSLNDQNHWLIRFERDGSGRGVRWSRRVTSGQLD